MNELNRVASFCEERGISNLINNSRAVVVGFSGGADSTFLLSVLPQLFPDVKIAAAHLNHKIRGKEAERDLAFCREFCRSHGIRFFEGEADVPKISAVEGKSAEEAGRDERYKFFDKCRKELAKELSCGGSEVLVATAHNADDNLETVLFNLARGTGLRGLRGIPAIRDGVYIRPILALSSKEIRDHCKENGIDYVVDSTNLEEVYTRNRIRSAVIPELEKINQDVRAGVLDTCALISDDEDHLEGEALAALGKAADSIESEKLLKLSKPIMSRAVRILYRRVAGISLDKEGVDAVLSALRSSNTGKLHLPGGVTAYYGKILRFAVESDKNATAEFCFEAKRGLNTFEKFGFSIGFFDGEEDAKRTLGDEIYNQLIYKIAINDKIKDNLFFRNRRDGDVYYIRSHHRRLKKLLCDSGVPVWERNLLPVVYDEEGIVWVPGFPPRDGLLAKDNDETRVLITYFNSRKLGKED